MIHISKTGCKNLRILEISRSKSHNPVTSFDKTCVLTISTKYLRLCGINCRIKIFIHKKIMTTNHRKVQILPILDKIIVYLDNQSQKILNLKKISSEKISVGKKPVAKKSAKFDNFQQKNLLIY